MKSKYFKFNIIHLFRFILCAGAFLSLSFNTAPVKKSPKNDNTSAFQLYSALINFQNSAVSPPSGYNKDYGKGFGNATISAIGSTFKYGWKNAATQAPIDISEEASGNGDGSGRNRLGNTYNSASSSEKLAGTFIHLQGNHIAGWQGQPRGNEAYWELEVPNGYLEVTLGLGDMGIYTDSRHTATVEGYSIIAAFQPQPRETKTITMLVKVDDEILTISGLGGYNSKIDYIEVHEIVDDENAVNGVLGFNPQSKNLNLIAGEEQGVLSSILSGAGATSIGLVIKDDMVTQNEELLNTNDWLTLPENPSTGQLNFTVNALGIQTGGTRNSIVIATAAGFKPATFDASLTIVAGCSPLSILPCNQLVQSMPLNLTFNGDQNGLADANGVATGFTTATPHSAPRLSQDEPASYSSVNGYEAGKINVANGNLTLGATKGLALLEENRQVNTLGVALQNLVTSFQIETKILNIDMPSTGSPQAGLNFGFNENYYVKLVVLNGNTIQLKKEIDSKSMSGLNNADNITVENLDLDGKNVSLRITFDITSATISGSYAVNGGGFMPLSSAGKSALELPETLLVGRINPNELAGASLAGIFASYNNASTTFDTTFDYFNINEVTLLSTATVKESLAKIKIYPNPVQENLNIVIPDQESGIKTISLYDLQGRLIRNYAPQRIKTNMGYRLATGNLSVGVYVIQLQNSNGNTAQIKFIKSK